MGYVKGKVASGLILLLLVTGLSWAGSFDFKKFSPEKIFDFLGDFRVFVMEAMSAGIEKKIAVPQSNTIAARGVFLFQD
jgi:hypothetical protein